MKKAYAFIALVLAMLCFSAPFFPLVSATEPADPSTITNRLDFSSDDEYMLRAVLSPSDLLTLLLETVYTNEDSLSEAEKEYLDRYFSEYLTYDGTLSPSLVSTETTDEGITVTAKAYSYQGKNGGTVTYLPVRASLGEKELSLISSSDGQSFSAEFSREFLGASDLSSVTVFYNGSVTLPKEIINRLVTMAYQDASDALAAEQTMLTYTLALEEYETYLRTMEDYEVQCLFYDNYLASLELYQSAVAEYEQNQRDWELYREKESAYQRYLAELKIYGEEKIRYEQAYAEYTALYETRLRYLKNLNAIRVAMNPMESLFWAPNNGKTRALYYALQNEELVLMFEKYRGILSKNFGIPEQTITNLRIDSDRLNALLGEYEKERKISEEAAFASYQKNYSEICFLFNSLYQKMTEILRPNIYILMCGKLELEYGKEMGAYKKWRIKNVLAHIYLICLCLDDTRNPENTWSFYNDNGEVHTYYYSDLLTQELIISDSNAANPSSLTWLAEVPTAVPPSMPLEPPVVWEPMKPATMTEPIPPQEIEMPALPQTVEKPLPPLESDHALVLRTGEICLALLDGTLPERAMLSVDPTVVLPMLSVEKNLHEISVYGAKGRLLSESDPSSLPIPSESSETLPVCFQDDYFVYTFEGWSQQPNTISLSSENTFISAKYRRTARTYRATFLIDGQPVHQTDVPVGTIPSFAGSNDKESTETLAYEFTTWNPPLAPIYEDTEYVAQYRAQPRKYSVTFAMANQSLHRQYEWQQIPVAPLTPSAYFLGGNLYEFEAWDRAFAPVTENTTYTARYRELALAKLPDDSNGSLSLALSAKGYILVSSQETVSISELIRLAVSEAKALEIIFSEQEASLSLDLTALQALNREGADRIFLQKDALHGTAVRFFKADGTEISLRQGEVRLRLNHGFASAENIYLSAYHPSLDRYQSNLSCSSNATSIELIAMAGVFYKPYQNYTLTLRVGEHGQATAKTTYAAGEEIQLTIRPDLHYRLASMTLIDPVSGASLSADPNHLVMPAWNAVLQIDFAPVEFRVEFIFHGQSIVQTLPFGATVVFPEIPLSFEENGFFYTFTGWTSTSTVITEDTFYIANYYCIRIEDVANSEEGNAWRTIFWKMILPLGIGILLFLGTVIALPIMIVKRRKKKKQQK